MLYAKLYNAKLEEETQKRNSVRKIQVSVSQIILHEHVFLGNSCVELQIVKGNIEEERPSKDLCKAKNKTPHSTSAVKVIHQPDLKFQQYVHSKDLVKQTELQHKEPEQYQKKTQENFYFMCLRTVTATTELV